MPDPGFTDELLWDAFRSGDERAYEMIYTNYVRELYSYAYHLHRNKEVVEDCIHDLFVYLYEHRKTLGATTSIKFYLFRSLRRLIVGTIEQRKNLVSSESLLPTFEFEIIPSHELSLIEDDATKEIQQKLQKLIAELPKRQKEALYLAYYEEFTHKQIAETMNVEIETVYNFIYRALATLKANAGTLLMGIIVLVNIFLLHVLL